MSGSLPGAILDVGSPWPGRETGVRPTMRTVAIVVAALGVLGGTIWLTVHLPAITLSAGLLLMLLDVVLLASLTDVWVAAVFAVITVSLANWFLIPPTHTLVIGSTEDVILLTVFVGCAVLSSVAVGAAHRRGTLARTSAAEAAGLRVSVAQPAGESDPVEMLGALATTHELSAVELVGPHDSVAARWGNDVPSRPPSIVIDLPEGYLVRGWGAEMIGGDPQSQRSLALGALRSHQARQLRDEAHRARDLAEADRAKSALLAAVGHDLRTPIATIRVAGDALSAGEGTLDREDRRAMLSTIIDSAARLDELVGNLLDLSRLEAGKVVANLTAVSVGALAAEAAESLVDGDVELLVNDNILALADPGLLRQVMVNLFSNAMRHGGGMAVCDGARAGSRVRVRVIDRGPGFPKGGEETMFEPFATAHPAGGVGMGLAIAKGFVETMGGEIWAEDTPGGGATVVVELPAAQ